MHLYTYDVRAHGSEIHMWGKSPDMDNVLLRILNVRYYVYSEINAISSGLSYDGGVISEVTERIRDLEYVVDVESVNMYNYFKDRHTPAFKIYLEEERDKYRIRTFMNLIELGDNRRVQYKTHELAWDNVMKFICDYDLSMNNWHTFSGREVEHGKISVDTVREYVLDIETDSIKLTEDRDITTIPLQLSTVAFDIETYCHKIYTFPKAIDVEDEIMMITLTLNRLGRLQNYALIQKRYHGEPIEDTEIVEYDSELDLLEGFQNILIELDPDIITGYNIYGFDLPYIQQRIQNLGRSWNNIGRLNIGTIESINRDAVMPWEKSDGEVDRNANKYKNRSKSNVDNVNLLIPGRLVIDIFPRIKSTFPNLKRYSLDSVAGQFLGEYKLDVSFEDLNKAFRDYDLTNLHYDPRQVYDDAIKYGIQDAVLTYRLFERLNIFVDLSMYSHVTTTSIPELLFKGTSGPVFRSMYREFKKRGYFFMERRIISEDYEGALVLMPEPGFYERVATVDINSLYPNVMITYNICPTTFIEEGRDFPDELCHVLEFEDRGKKYRYRFRKDIEGIVPSICRDLIDRRKEVRSRKAADEFEAILNDKLQLALKINVNTVYGAYGIKKHRFSFLQGARAVTAMGRHLLQSIIDKIQNEYKLDVIYGDTDSVMFQLPEGLDYRSAHAQADTIKEELNAWLPGTIELDLEKIGLLLIMKRKKYKYRHWDKRTNEFEIDRDGNSVYHTTGAESVRRDRCRFRSTLYDNITDWIMENKSAEFIDEQVFNAAISFMKRYNEFTESPLQPDDLYINIAVNDGPIDSNYSATVMLNRLKSEQYNITSGERVNIIYIKNDANRVGEKMYTSKEYETSHSEGINPYTPDLYYYLTNRFSSSVDGLVGLIYTESRDMRVLYRDATNRIDDPINEEVIAEYYEGLFDTISAPLMDVVDEALSKCLPHLRMNRPDDQITFTRRYENILILVNEHIWEHLDESVNDPDMTDDLVELNNLLMDQIHRVFSVHTSNRDSESIHQALKKSFRESVDKVCIKYTKTLKKELAHVKRITSEIKEWGFDKCLLIKRVWEDLEGSVRNLRGLFSSSNWDHQTFYQRMRHLRSRVLKQSKNVSSEEAKIFRQFKHRFDYLINSKTTWLGPKDRPMEYVSNLISAHRDICESIRVGVNLAI